MKAYIVTTGIVFALLFAAHIARVAVEGSYVLKEPIFFLTTIASLALVAWAAVLSFSPSYKG